MLSNFGIFGIILMLVMIAIGVGIGILIVKNIKKS